MPTKLHYFAPAGAYLICSQADLLDRNLNDPALMLQINGWVCLATWIAKYFLNFWTDRMWWEQALETEFTLWQTYQWLVTCLFIVAIAFVTPFIACAIASLDFNVWIFNDTAWILAFIKMNFFTYLRVRTRSFAMIFTASWKQHLTVDTALC